MKRLGRRLRKKQGCQVTIRSFPSVQCCRLQSHGCIEECSSRSEDCCPLHSSNATTIHRYQFVQGQMQSRIETNKSGIAQITSVAAVAIVTFVSNKIPYYSEPPGSLACQY